MLLITIISFNIHLLIKLMKWNTVDFHPSKLYIGFGCYIPVNNFEVMSGRFCLPGLNQYLAADKCDMLLTGPFIEMQSDNARLRITKQQCLIFTVLCLFTITNC